MSVDYYHCEVCDESRYEEYVGTCTKCGKSLCAWCLVNYESNSPYVHGAGYTFDSENPELMKKYEEEGFSLYDNDGVPCYEDGDTIDDSSIAPNFCPYCSGDVVDRDSVLNYLLDKYDLSINDVWREIKTKS